MLGLIQVVGVDDPYREQKESSILEVANPKRFYF